VAVCEIPTRTWCCWGGGTFFTFFPHQLGARALSKVLNVVESGRTKKVEFKVCPTISLFIQLILILFLICICMCVLLFSMDVAAKDLNALKAQVQGGQLDAASASLSKLKVGTTI
jgi:hypothetical protein